MITHKTYNGLILVGILNIAQNEFINGLTGQTCENCLKCTQNTSTF
ncbi:hypothetical protein HanIR_Chr01g0014341 [Helianthus annuus]|nr:hypothetical protein HanIR_Chr01g0014341 [Helianthus annuus]